ncbi:hypothetical protein P8452_18665 [Trifolium repens]|nr:hypothetical protein P8452_18665 [Trifolium repens]
MPTSTDTSANWTPHEVALTGSMVGVNNYYYFAASLRFQNRKRELCDRSELSVHRPIETEFFRLG